MLVLETVTDLILPLIFFERLALTMPSLGSFNPPSLIEQLSGNRIDYLECLFLNFGNPVLLEKKFLNADSKFLSDCCRTAAVGSCSHL